MMVSTRILIKTDFDNDNNKCFFVQQISILE